MRDAIGRGTDGAGPPGAPVEGAAPGAGPDERPATIIEVAVSRNKLTFDVRNARLGQVLRAIGERAGIEVIVRGDLGGPMNLLRSGFDF